MFRHFVIKAFCYHVANGIKPVTDIPFTIQITHSPSLCLNKALNVFVCYYDISNNSYQLSDLSVQPLQKKLNFLYQEMHIKCTL